MIEVTQRWQQHFEGGSVGVVLLGNLDNTKPSAPLETRKQQLEARLRQQFSAYSRAQLVELEVLKAYRDYYRRFDQTYHVQLQLESVIHKGKSLPSISPLVDASFMAELQTLVLTASHDADQLSFPLRIDATRGGEAFTQMNGKERQLKANDMMMLDQRGIICTILYGQDQRTPVRPATRRALYVTYAPAGVSAAIARGQLELICDNVRLFAPTMTVERLELIVASP